MAQYFVSTMTTQDFNFQFVIESFKKAKQCSTVGWKDDETHRRDDQMSTSSPLPELLLIFTHKQRMKDKFSLIALSIIVTTSATASLPVTASFIHYTEKCSTTKHSSWQTLTQEPTCPELFTFLMSEPSISRLHRSFRAY